MNALFVLSARGAWPAAIVGLFVLAAGLAAAEPPAGKPAAMNPFFAFDNGTGRGELAPVEQARMLAELGYEGIGYTGTKGIPEMLDALDQHGLKMFSTYVGATISPDGPSIDPNLKEAAQALKGRETILWLFIRGTAPDAEQQAVRLTRDVADLAAEAGLRVVLYPHYGFYVDRVEAAVRIVQKVDRRNVGVSFNLCHFLRAGDEPNLDLRLREAMPRLWLVSVNGADRQGGWDRLIQTLDRGEYDVCALLKKLRKLGYHGPVGLQCYQVPGDRRENLTRSMGAWREFARRLAANQQ